MTVERIVDLSEQIGNLSTVVTGDLPEVVHFLRSGKEQLRTFLANVVGFDEHLRRHCRWKPKDQACS